MPPNELDSSLFDETPHPEASKPQAPQLNDSMFDDTPHPDASAKAADSNSVLEGATSVAQGAGGAALGGLAGAGAQMGAAKVVPALAEKLAFHAGGGRATDTGSDLFLDDAMRKIEGKDAPSLFDVQVNHRAVGREILDNKLLGPMGMGSEAKNAARARKNLIEASKPTDELLSKMTTEVDKGDIYSRMKQKLNYDKLDQAVPKQKAIYNELSALDPSNVVDNSKEQEMIQRELDLIRANKESLGNQEHKDTKKHNLKVESKNLGFDKKEHNLSKWESKINKIKNMEELLQQQEFLNRERELLESSREYFNELISNEDLEKKELDKKRKQFSLDKRETILLNREQELLENSKNASPFYGKQSVLENERSKRDLQKRVDHAAPNKTAQESLNKAQATARREITEEIAKKEGLLQDLQQAKSRSGNAGVAADMLKETYRANKGLSIKEPVKLVGELIKGKGLGVTAALTDTLGKIAKSGAAKVAGPATGALFGGMIAANAADEAGIQNPVERTVMGLGESVAPPGVDFSQGYVDARKELMETRDPASALASGIRGAVAPAAGAVQAANQALPDLTRQVLNAPDKLPKMLDEFGKGRSMNARARMEQNMGGAPKEDKKELMDFTSTTPEELENLAQMLSTKGGSEALFSGPLSKAAQSDDRQRSAILYGLHQQPAFRALLRANKDKGN